ELKFESNKRRLIAILNDASNDKTSLAQSKRNVGTEHLAMQECFRNSSTELEPNRTDWHNIVEEELSSNNAFSQGLTDAKKENMSEHLSKNLLEPSAYLCIEGSRHTTKAGIELSTIGVTFVSESGSSISSETLQTSVL
ncbi:11799_t:CDS:1, partial [Cetraspora pellucida]